MVKVFNKDTGMILVEVSFLIVDSEYIRYILKTSDPGIESYVD